MRSTAGDVLPALPPIRTAAASAHRAESARSSPAAASSSTAPDAESRPSEKWEEEEARSQEEAEPTTPTSEESRLQLPTECPPAPRKPAWAPPLPAPAPAKRKFPLTSAPSSVARRAFFPVARDLSTVFRPLPPKKRIRAG